MEKTVDNYVEMVDFMENHRQKSIVDSVKRLLVNCRTSCKSIC